MTAVKKVLRGFKPLAYARGGVVLARGFDLYLASLDLEQRTWLARIPSGALRAGAARWRPLARLLRCDLGPALLLPDEEALLVAAAGKLYRVALDGGAVDLDFTIPRGNRPLYLKHVAVGGFDAGVYFGEYIANPGKGPVSIFARSGPGCWRTAYTFPAGAINHIHNLVPDPARERLFILTGDFEDAAAIWAAGADFATVERWLGAGQQSRACWLNPDGDAYLYASDTQFDVNHLYRVETAPDGAARALRLFPLAGSAIYQAERADGATVFSTAVEPNDSQGARALLDRRPHDGMLGNAACIYSGSTQAGFTVLARGVKDAWPMRLFQFGSFSFPSGCSPDPRCLHAYGVALRRYDGCTLLLSLEDA